VIPDVKDLEFGKRGRESELAMMFIDIRESTKIVDGSRRITAAKMYNSFL
jgi:class 3 adenylate cyclase